jgi:hypothetical protein
MKMRRFCVAVCALFVGGSSLTARADGWAPNLFASPEARQQAAEDASAVQMDDSQLWVVERPNTGAPIVDVANKKKKAPPSFWSRMMHPTQWFSSGSKKK